MDERDDTGNARPPALRPRTTPFTSSSSLPPRTEAIRAEGDDFGAYCPLPGADAGSCYTLCHLPFTGLTRDGFKSVEAGAPNPGTDKFDPSDLVKIQFEFSSYMAADSSVSAEPVTFDVWIDSVAFLPPM